MTGSPCSRPPPGRPKSSRARSIDRPNDAAARATHREARRAAVLRALDAYAPDTLAVLDVDLGHTDPQVVIPYGGTVRVGGPARRITVTCRRRPGRVSRPPARTGPGGPGPAPRAARPADPAAAPGNPC
ncbi:hypothetical protein GCM10017667_77000 [Streptomyces filamentosus]|uniref:LD-carboxypeptidase C-terminal domain-containing protein n=1 Tax=Streptomyces filamentosus TaxID=67294 RepID=A0A919BXF6_STRFL|nr:hypothetical protein GCM10017667_77000 [Streptomyces filamentosus]